MQRELRWCAVLLLSGAILCAALGWATMLPQATSVEQTPRTNFYFAQITDTHFGDKDHEQRTRKVVQAINKLPMKIEFVVHTGDITMDKIEDVAVVTDVITLIGTLKAPIHYIPGNHDILRHRHNDTMEAYKNHFGELITQLEYHGVVFMFVYTEPLAKAFSVPNYDPLDELETRLKQSDRKPVIVFHHTPSVEDFYMNRMHPGWKKEIREKWIALLNKHNVKAVIAGHFHRDEHHWLGDVPLYVCSPIAGYWGRQSTYRIYEYKNGKIGYRTQYIRSETNHGQQ